MSERTVTRVDSEKPGTSRGTSAIPLSRQAHCEFCKRVLDATAQGVYQYTSGWVMRRDGGGGHGVSLPERANRWAHGTCVDSAVRGFSDQKKLF